MARYVGDNLRQRESFNLEEPTGYGGPNDPIGRLLITSVNLEEKNSYLPAVTILTEPRTFMALAPASTALKIAQVIKEKYEKEVGKVRNRLPLTLGIVFAGSRTPLPAILDSGRRMLKQPTESELWLVKSVDSSSNRGKAILILEKNEQTLPIEVPTTMGDGTTEDFWYPYWRVEKDKNDTKPLGRTRQFTGADGKEWVHIHDLEEGDAVSYMPSRFDFEFLDTAARRFEVSYDDNGNRQGSSHPSRPYYLEQLEDFEKLWKMLSNGLAASQIDNLVGIIETKRTEWAAHQSKDVFEQMVFDALNNANWRNGSHPDSDGIKKLCQYAVSGQLTDTVELYMSILKRKTIVDDMGGN